MAIHHYDNLHSLSAFLRFLRPLGCQADWLSISEATLYCMKYDYLNNGSLDSHARLSIQQYGTLMSMSVNLHFHVPLDSQRDWLSSSAVTLLYQAQLPILTNGWLSTSCGYPLVLYFCTSAGLREYVSYIEQLFVTPPIAGPSWSLL